MVDFENFNAKLENIVESNSGKKLKPYFQEKRIFLIGNGGNMGVASRLKTFYVQAVE